MMKKKGFALLEVLVTTLIFAIMSVGIVYFIANSNRVLNSGIRQANIHTNASRILNMIARDIKEGAIVKNDGNILSCLITNPDSTQVRWNSRLVDGKKRIFRNDVQIPFFGDRSGISEHDYVYMSMVPSLEGKYFKTELTFSVRTDSEYVVLNTTAYCRHSPSGHFDPQDFM